MSEPLLSIRDLTVEYGTAEATVVAVQGVSLDLDAGEVLGVVGESGSGKTSIGYAILGHLGGAGRARGQILFCGTDLATLERHAWNGLRGSRIGMVYQEPQSALNPAYTVGEQIAEGLRHHLDLSRRAARDRAVEWLERVHMPEPATIYDRYPHQLSGGQLQRAVIAMTFAPGPELVVMDEPTTGLDVTTQARILDLVAELGKQTGVGILYISHDLSVVADLCDRVIVMHRGKVVEQGSATAVLQRPRQPYTQRLVASIPNLERRQSFAGHNDGTADETGAVQVRFLPPLPSTRRTAATVLELHGVQKIYRSRGQATVACDDVDLDVRAGECVALIGESGSGKSTVAKCILGLERPDGGQIMLDGVALPPSVHQRALDLRRRIQIVFQNPDGSLNGRRTIGDTLKRPLVIHGRGRNRHELEAASAELMESVDLSADFLARYPHELSGGQKQRVAIARALASRPELIICDEPVSALDVSVQSVILDLCRRLQAEQGVAFLFITHDLGVVRQMAERAVVMLKGRVCHVGDVDSLFAKDAHPYVRDLIASVPGRRLAEHRAQPQQA